MPPGRQRYARDCKRGGNSCGVIFPTPTVLGSVLSVALALAADGLLLWAQRLVTPWARVRQPVRVRGAA